ncbi:glycosyl hydrolase family 18 protein [Bacillus sp. EB600]|uniref:glycosyl hydrolase family 18 protein n=1 Tax=Bacillus sp. EB600 TaxID=2806345 RepID=UPI00210926C2|nr:glycosyl hydrolase family 18 protein [Bacillus sp. EB600]MCQ6280568.1 LysM peptidoglycan-binding domain-containing protein [Bacillus sp. EB600]
MSVHVVGSGENLWSISKLYGVSIKSIVDVNGLSSAAVVVPGLSLYIPDNTLPIRAYRIKAGDTPWKLTQEFNSSLSLIRTANPGLDLNHLRIDQVIYIPSTKKLIITTLGFLVPSAKTATLLSIIDSLSRQITYLAVVAYSFTNEGFAFNEVDDSAIVAKCKQKNIIPLLMIRNYTAMGFNAELAGKVLESPIYRKNLVTSIVKLTTDRGFRGVSVDFEFIPPARRHDFNLFLIELKRSLGNLLLHVNVHAKAADLPTNRIVGAYDYAAIGKTVDLMAVMTIDYGYPGGPPDPIAPYWWVVQVIKYALTKLNPQKLLIAMPLYGYDKDVMTNTTQALSALAAQNQAISKRATIQFDNTAKSPWYRYWSGTKENIVWFEDIRSYIEKYNLIDIYKLVGTTYWQISLPAPQNWAYLSKNITVVKNRFYV